MKITAALFAEHFVFHNLFDHIEKAAPGIQTLAEIKSLAALMEAMLKAHSDAEEKLLFHPLGHCLEQIGQREVFHQEHDEIDRALLNVQNAKRLSGAREMLMAAVVASRKHFDKEERIVFSMAEKSLKNETLEELGRAWMDQRKEPVV